MVGRTPWSAADALVGVFGRRKKPARGPAADQGSAPTLLFVVVHGHRLQIFGFDDQTAVQAFDIIDAVTTGDDDGTVVFTIGWNLLHLGLHKDDL